MKVIHKETNTTICRDLKVANTMISKMIGLMFVKEIKGMDGLLLQGANSIHNCFVRFPIDVVFLTKDMKVVKVIRGFKPWRFTRIYFSAKHVLELPEGTLNFEINQGDELEVQGV